MNKLIVTTIIFLVLMSSSNNANSQMNTPEMTTGYVLTNDYSRIYYDHYKGGHKQVIVLAHGFYNSKKAILFKDMAEGLQDEYDVIVMDFRGHGKSSGLFTWTAKEHQDVEAILEYTKLRYRKIGVIGFSLGAASSIIAASKTDSIDSLIAVSPPTKFRKINFHVWKMGIMENIVYNVFQEGRIGKGVRPAHLWMKKESPIDRVGKVNCPILFLHGKKDWLISPKHSQKLYEKANDMKEIKLIEEGTHAEYLFRNDREGTIRIFKEWFQKTFKEDAA